MVFMKVLCLIDGLGSGGAQRQLVGLASLLKKEGYDVLVVYYHGDHFFVPFLKELDRLLFGWEENIENDTLYESSN